MGEICIEFVFALLYFSFPNKKIRVQLLFTRPGPSEAKTIGYSSVITLSQQVTALVFVSRGRKMVISLSNGMKLGSIFIVFHGQWDFNYFATSCQYYFLPLRSVVCYI
jgi:hypothetical protein